MTIKQYYHRISFTRNCTLLRPNVWISIQNDEKRSRVYCPLFQLQLDPLVYRIYSSRAFKMTYTGNLQLHYVKLNMNGISCPVRICYFSSYHFPSAFLSLSFSSSYLPLSTKHFFSSLYSSWTCRLSTALSLRTLPFM